MTRKLMVIGSCFECDRCELNTQTHEQYCTELDDVVPAMGGFHEDCPLPDEPDPE